MKCFLEALYSYVIYIRLKPGKSTPSLQPVPSPRLVRHLGQALTLSSPACRPPVGSTETILQSWCVYVILMQKRGSEMISYDLLDNLLITGGH